MRSKASAWARLRQSSHAAVRLGFCLALVLVQATASAGDKLPWGASADMIAWETFVQAMAPAGLPGSAQREFETWASDDDLYVKSPPEWPALGAREPPPPCKQTFDKGMASAARFPLDACVMEDIRRNWAAFRYIVSHGLYAKQGLAEAFKAGVKVDLPPDAVQVKADWMKIGDLTRWLGVDEATVRKNYYVKTEPDGEGTVAYALLGVHLNAKRVKNWVWATFEHRANPGRCDDQGCHDSFGAVAADIRARIPANQDYGDCVKTPALLALFASAGFDAVWRNYCLKGTQTDFSDKDGKPKLLGNSLVDRINGRIPMTSASCMTCHGLAAFDATGEVSGAFADNAIGKIDPTKLDKMMTNGFVWGIMLLKPPPAPADGGVTKNVN
jgi:hypothetical protein